MRLPVSLCPICGYRLDAATSLTEGKATPGEGDYTICMGCSSALRFTKEMGVRVATSEDMSRLKNEDPEGWRMLQRGIEIVQREIVDKHVKLKGYNK